MKTDGLDRALQTLEPYLGDLVLCGAWAWYLYRRCLGPDRWMPAEFTRDLDCIGPERLPVRGSLLFDRLEAESFEWVPRGSDTPPAAHFAWPNHERPEIEIEFLVPRRGDGSKRIVELQQGITAQALRHLDILMDSPLELIIDDASPVASDLEFRGSIWLPTMGHFVIQKALIHARREHDDQVKDVFYVFDLIDSENGLAIDVTEDVLAAEGAWKSGVDELLQFLERRVQEPVFLRRVLEQYPEERRPSVAYAQREIQNWLGELKASRQA